MKVRAWPDPVLRRKASPAEPTDPGTRALAGQMIRTMEAGRGIGLAANQVGVLKRVVVIGRIPGVLEEPLVLVNPEITEAGGSCIEEEGCLSFPGLLAAPVRRYRDLTAYFHDLEGTRMKISASGLLARVIQHEIDHLDGIVFPDRLNFCARKSILRRYAQDRKPGKPGNREPEKAGSRS